MSEDDVQFSSMTFLVPVFLRPRLFSHSILLSNHQTKAMMTSSKAV